VSTSNISSENLTIDANKVDGSSVCQTQTDKIAMNVNNTQGKTFLDSLETSRDAKNSNSVITSATQILKEGEHQWLNSEVIYYEIYNMMRYILYTIYTI